MLIQSPPQKHVSNEDRSVNFVWPVGNPNDMLEARFVRRTDDYFIVYVSSHSGCNQACRFCHLTATKQAGMLPAALDDLLTQADAVFGYYDQQIRTGSQPPAQRVNINWMARGEPLLNDTLVVNGGKELLDALAFRARNRRLVHQFNVSTIFPKDRPLDEVEPLFANPSVRLYYSLYSLDPTWRKRWIPKGHEPERVLDWLAAMQTKYGHEIAIHGAFIANENDSQQNVESIASAIASRQLNAKFNLVRYNPFSDAQGAESEESVLMVRLDTLKAVTTENTRMVPRVGFDVKASCGMFMQP